MQICQQHVLGECPTLVVSLGLESSEEEEGAAPAAAAHPARSSLQINYFSHLRALTQRLN